MNVPPDQQDRQAAYQQAHPYGDAGSFKGRGVFLGSNPDVWEQASLLAKQGHLETVAVTPGTPLTGFPCFVMHWIPPEQEPAVGAIHQAENQREWNTALEQKPAAIVLNAWTYGRFPSGTVAMVESYWNEGWGVDFGIYQNYMSQGASAVVPVCGGYAAQGRSNEESARLYANLSKLPFSGFWMFAGESPLTDESVEVLKGWTP